MRQRHYSRAEKLGATALMVALHKIMPKLLQGNQQANFRLSAFRIGAQVDTKPTAATVKQLHHMLLAEVELALGSTEASGKPQGGPAVKTLKDQKTGTGSPAQVQPACRCWKSEGGCKHGAQCRFQHRAHEDGKCHCYTCGATSRKKPDCPYSSPSSPNKDGKGQTAPVSSQGTPAGGSGSGGGNGKSSGKQGKGNPKGKGGAGGKNGNAGDLKGNTTGSKDDKKNVKSRLQNRPQWHIAMSKR